MGAGSTYLENKKTTVDITGFVLRRTATAKNNVERILGMTEKRNIVTHDGGFLSMRVTEDTKGGLKIQAHLRLDLQGFGAVSRPPMKPGSRKS